MTDDQIRETLLANGFSIKPGHDDLKPYVYAAVRTLLAHGSTAGAPAEGFIDIVFDAPPGKTSGRFIEVEDDKGFSIRFGEWVHRPDGYWALRFAASSTTPPAAEPVHAATIHQSASVGLSTVYTPEGRKLPHGAKLYYLPTDAAKGE